MQLYLYQFARLIAFTRSLIMIFEIASSRFVIGCGIVYRIFLIIIQRLIDKDCAQLIFTTPYVLFFIYIIPN